ncbi:MAG: hypothetical protein GY757_18805 [bacterium]|nr:hypothetical protein [bacterium]
MKKAFLVIISVLFFLGIECFASGGYGGGSRKIDDAAVDGLLGVNNSLAYKVHEIEKHFHSPEFWFGNDGDNTMSRANNTTPWVLDSGAQNVYGTEVLMAAANDFNADIEGYTAAVKIDLHEIAVVESETNDVNYMIQFWAGTGTFGEATFLTEVPYRTGGNAAEAQPIKIMCPRFAVGSKIWGRVKCSDATSNRQLSILIGIHGYKG